MRQKYNKFTDLFIKNKYYLQRFYLIIKLQPTMTFHKEHGVNMRLSADSRVATATRNQGFDCGLCVLSIPISDIFYAPNSTCDVDESSPPGIMMLVTQTEAELSGGLGLGVPARPPASRSTVLPTSSSNAGKGWAFMQVPQNAVTVGTLMTVWLDRAARELCYATSKSDAGEAYGNETDESSGELPLDDPEILDLLDTRQPLWLYIDVYGFVKEVKLLGACLY